MLQAQYSKNKMSGSTYKGFLMLIYKNTYILQKSIKNLPTH